ncbi:TIGR02757 family protein [Flexistipes sinusarabici]|uniref:TIGR02757 family protein n=1 Tax=Flexistipes sinusarabici TaxID=2352 RepID=UPI0026F0ABD3|nr:TIGR02757 family protein [Flexistipes sinusarabici]
MHSITDSSERAFWDKIYFQYTRGEFIDTDPIIFPARIDGNKEYISFVSSLFAYGRVRAIQDFLEKFFFRYGNNPFEIDTSEAKLYYRFQTAGDIRLLVSLIKEIYIQYGSIQKFFISLSSNLDEALEGFLDYARMFGTENNAGRGYFFLFPKYGGSGLKRLRMFLRWMVRKDDVDFGLWDTYKASELLYPLDTHILRFAKGFGIISSWTNSHRNARLITDYFKAINEEDPVKYDFAITRLGMLNSCKFKTSIGCEVCGLKNECLFN